MNNEVRTAKMYCDHCGDPIKWHHLHTWIGAKCFHNKCTPAARFQNKMKELIEQYGTDIGERLNEALK